MRLNMAQLEADTVFFKEAFNCLKEMKRQKILCDVKLRGKSKGILIDAHKIILASRSDFFKAMFTSNMKENQEGYVTLESIENNILDKIINFLYTGNITLIPSEVEELLDASHMLGIDQVQEKCFHFLLNNIDITNCYGIAYLAEKYSCREISKVAETYAIKNFRLVSNTDEFLDLTYEHLLALVSSSELNVTSEGDVYNAIMKWVYFDKSRRKLYLKSLLAHVRFPLLTRKFLIDKVTKEELIIGDSGCREYLYNALDYHLVPERRYSSSDKMYSPRLILTSSIYVIGGENRTGPLDSVEMFDVTSQQWQKCKQLTVARKHPAVVALNGIVYCIGGIDEDCIDISSMEKYDPSLEYWVKGPSLTKCKGAVAVTVLDGWLYAAGGSSGGSPLKFVERYDPMTDEWNAVQPMKHARCFFAMGVIGHKICAIGGYFNLSETERCEMFDPSTNKWQEMADLNKARMNHGVATIADKIYAIGGQNTCGLLDCIEKYNKGLNMWLVIKHTLNPRTGASIFPVKSGLNDDWLFIIGGIDGSHCYHSSVKRINWKSIDYCVGSGKSMNEPRAYGGCCSL